MSYIIGVDIGGTTIKLGIFDSKKDSFIDKWEISTDVDNDGQNILSDINKSIRDTLKKKNISINSVEGVGFGIPGPVDGKGVVHKCVNLGWQYINIAEEFAKLMPVTIKASNDANVAALGEYWKGGGKGYENIVMITLGTGIGSGIIVNGKIVTGAVGAAGEIGHLHINNNETQECTCGNKGCLEQYSSATGIVREAKKVVNSVKESTELKYIKEITAKDIFDFAKEGDRISMLLIDELADRLGLICSYVCCVINPDLIMFGGGLAKSGEMLTNAIKQHFLNYAFHTYRDTEFKLAELGNYAGIFGAVKLIAQNE